MICGQGQVSFLHEQGMEAYLMIWFFSRQNEGLFKYLCDTCRVTFFHGPTIDNFLYVLCFYVFAADLCVFDAFLYFARIEPSCLFMNFVHATKRVTLLGVFDYRAQRNLNFPIAPTLYSL